MRYFLTAQLFFSFYAYCNHGNKQIKIVYT
nr:MAG TPA: hypothetical protein [Caudoviricetes sp.]DAW22942.1 MAG TPA: hypothetical protein [Caudoviricetes sp.]